MRARRTATGDLIDIATEKVDRTVLERIVDGYEEKAARLEMENSENQACVTSLQRQLKVGGLR